MTWPPVTPYPSQPRPPGAAGAWAAARALERLRARQWRPLPALVNRATLRDILRTWPPEMPMPMTRNEYDARRLAGRLTADEYAAPGATYWKVAFLGGKGRLEEWRVARFGPRQGRGLSGYRLDAIQVLRPGAFPAQESTVADTADELGGYRDPEAALLAALAEVEWECQERQCWVRAALAAAGVTAP